jgi:glycosyltransferase involved in cell wall biosynthesis
MNNKKVKICMNSMFANEAHVVERMLESCYKYIDYWVVQINGSTDGTKDIVQRFFDEKGIPGFLYETEWKGFGYNRDHTLQACLNSDHGCDWILRMDADEQLVVDEDFDWSVFDDLSIQSFNVTAQDPGGIYYRTWMWNAKLPWYFQHDLKHEVIALKGSNPPMDNNFQWVNLPKSFRHIITNDGMTWSNNFKFLKDALELEADQVCSGKIKDNDYHLFYIGKSYSDCFTDSGFPFGKSHSDEYARRTIYYLEHYVARGFPNYLEHSQPNRLDEMAYFSIVLIGNAHRFMGNMELAIERLTESEWYCPVRNEHIVYLAEIYESLGNYEKMYEMTSRLISPERKNPFPDWYFLVFTNAYHDTGDYVWILHDRAKQHLGIVDTPKPSFEFPGMV